MIPEKLNFATLFDRNYLTRALALYESLVGNCPQFDLWALCMDDESAEILGELKLPSLHVVRLGDVETPALLQAKAGRTPVEYCWTCAPVICKYVLDRFPSLDHVIYVDADVFFFRSTAALFEELGNGSVLIFEHHLPARLKEEEEKVGRFNVGVVVFMRDRGYDCLAWWEQKCIEWCFYRVEPGRMGDQKYLDEWPTRFQGVVVGSDRVPAAGPWSLEMKPIQNQAGIPSVAGNPVLFYHYSKLTVRSYRRFDLCHGYELTDALKKTIYKPYTGFLTRQYERVARVRPGFVGGIVPLRAGERMRRVFSPLTSSIRLLKTALRPSSNPRPL
jgi:hypothetical protein